MRISDLTRHVDVAAEEPRLKRLIYQAAVMSTSVDSIITRTGVQIEVHNGIGELPCDLYRLLRVYPLTGNIYGITGDVLGNNIYGTRTQSTMDVTKLNLAGKYDYNDNFIKPAWVREGMIAIDYYAIPTLEVPQADGTTCLELSISMEQMEYRAYDSIATFFRDKWISGKVSEGMYREWESKADGFFRKAKHSLRRISIDKMEGMAWLSRNGQFFNLK